MGLFGDDQACYWEPWEVFSGSLKTNYIGDMFDLSFVMGGGQCAARENNERNY